MATVLIGNSYVTVWEISPGVAKVLDRATSYLVAGYFHDPRFKRKIWDGREHLMQKLLDPGSYRLPVGLVDVVRKVLREQDVRTTYGAAKAQAKPPKLDLPWQGPKLRGYQLEAVAAFVDPKRTQSLGRGILNMPIRSGKTLTAAAVASALGTTTIFLVPSQLLLEQTYKAFTKALKADIGIIGKGVWKPRDVTIASVQMLAARRTKNLMTAKPEYRALAGKFGLVIFDECFPAGTLVDGRRIETIKTGDMVMAFDEKTGAFRRRYVVRTFKSKPSTMVTVHTAAGAVSCTSSHPFWTRRGWVAAGALQSNDMVLYTTHGEEDPPDDVSHLRQSGGLRGMERVPEEKASVLLHGMQPDLSEQALIGDDGGDKSQACLDANEGEQPNEAARGASQGECQSAGQGMEPTGATRRQRAGTNRSANASGEHPGLEDGARSLDGEEPREGAADTLQGRHCEPGVDDRNRGERGITLHPESSSEGRPESRGAFWARVDRVELHEQGSDGTFGGLCTDGHVYNLEVEEFHTYVANGFVVHNCHHLTGKVWHKVMLDIDARYRLGLSATVFLDDSHEVERGAVWLKACTGDVVYKVSTSRLVDEGHLLRPDVRLHRVTEPDLSDIDEWSQALKTEGVYMNDGRNQLISDLAVEHVGLGRRTLVVSKSLKQVADLVARINAAGILCEPMIGSTPDSKRQKLIAKFIAGDLLVIVGTVFGEGVDIPECEAVINADAGRDKKATVQRMRCLTPSPGKSGAYVDDFMDFTNPYLTRHSLERLKVYREEPAFKVRMIPART